MKKSKIDLKRFFSPFFLLLLALVITAVSSASSVQAATVYSDGVSGPVSEVILGDFRPDLSVHGRAIGSLGNAAGDNLDGSRIFIWDFLDVTFSRYAMMVFEMDQPYDGVRLYTHQDHYNGGPITSAFVAQDVMEYSVWGSNAATPNSLADWVLLSDVIAFDINGDGPGKPTYTFVGLDGGEPSIVFRGGSPEFGILNAYTREYHFSNAYKWFGFRTSTISIIAVDADPELDAIGGFFKVDRIDDADPPSCALTAVNFGPPISIEITAQDDDSGLDQINVLDSKNVVVDIPPFVAGTNDPVVVTATKINQSKGASVKLEAIDVAGNVTVCDPVITLEIRDNGKPESHTFDDIPQAESNVTVQNGDPGVKNLDIVVNGMKYKVAGLADDEEVTLDISASMVEGDNNTIALTAYGKPGAKVTVVISD